MKISAVTLLREFPKVRRAALSGEAVIIKTREGNLRLTRDDSSQRPILGCLKGRVVACAGDIDQPTSGLVDVPW